MCRLPEEEEGGGGGGRHWGGVTETGPWESLPRCEQGAQNSARRQD